MKPYYIAVNVNLDEDGELFGRAAAQAERYGLDVNKMLDTIAQMNLQRHMSANLAVFEGQNPPPVASGDGQGQDAAEAEA